MPTATRSLAQSDLLIVSSSHRPLSPITRHGGRGGNSCPSVACFCGSFAITVRFALRAICAGSVEDGVGGCLACLAVILCILSMGDGISAAVRVRPLICLDAPAHPLSSPSPSSTHIAAPGVASILSLARGLAAFLSTCHAPFAYLTMANGAWYFYAYPFCGELTKTARAVSRCQFNLISPVLSPPLPRCLCGCVVFLSRSACPPRR